jgi:hypothetical protein
MCRVNRYELIHHLWPIGLYSTVLLYAVFLWNSPCPPPPHICTLDGVNTEHLSRCTYEQNANRVYQVCRVCGRAFSCGFLWFYMCRNVYCSSVCKWCIWWVLNVRLITVTAVIQSPVLELICVFYLVNGHVLLLTASLKNQDKAVIPMGKYTKIMRPSRETCKFYAFIYAGDGENTLGCLFCLRR